MKSVILERRMVTANSLFLKALFQSKGSITLSDEEDHGLYPHPPTASPAIYYFSLQTLSLLTIRPYAPKRGHMLHHAAGQSASGRDSQHINTTHNAI